MSELAYRERRALSMEDTLRGYYYLRLPPHFPPFAGRQGSVCDGWRAVREASLVQPE